MADFVVRFHNFSGGDWGIVADDKAYSYIRGHVLYNQYSARNMALYPSGLVGVRPGFKLFNPLSNFIYNPPSGYGGPLRGFDVVNDRILVGLDTNTYEMYWTPPPGGLPTFGPTPNPVGLSTTAPMQFFHADDSHSGTDWMLCDGRLFVKVAKVVFPQWYEVTLPAQLSLVVRWGLFLVGVDRNVPSRIWFSRVDASGPSFGTWPATNFLDVGTTDPITTLLPIFNMLYAGKAAGWSGISGVLGTLASVRELATGNGPAPTQRYAAVTTDNRIAYWPALQKVPAMWDGARVSLVSHQRMEERNLTGFTAGMSVITTPTEHRTIFTSANSQSTFYSLKDGVWARHYLAPGMTAIAWAPSDVRTAYKLPERTVFAAQPPISGIGLQIWSVQHDLDRPAFDSDTYASPFDEVLNTGQNLVQGSMLLAAWFDGEGRQVRVRSVEVQFRKWQYLASSPSVTSLLQCRVDALGEWDGGRVTGAVQQWMEANSLASATGTDDSVRFNFGDQGWGNGFQIALPVVRGIAIREVIALVDVRTPRT